MINIGINEKRLGLRLATLVTALYAFEPTRGMIYGFTSFQIGPISLLTVCGALTALFVVANWRNKI